MSIGESRSKFCSNNNSVPEGSRLHKVLNGVSMGGWRKGWPSSQSRES